MPWREEPRDKISLIQSEGLLATVSAKTNIWEREREREIRNMEILFLKTLNKIRIPTVPLCEYE